MAYHIAGTAQPVSLTQLLKAPGRQLMGPFADDRLVCHQLLLWQQHFCLLGCLSVACAWVEQVIQGSSLCHQLTFQPLNQVATAQFFCSLIYKQIQSAAQTMCAQDRHKWCQMAVAQQIVSLATATVE